MKRKKLKPNYYKTGGKTVSKFQGGGLATTAAGLYWDPITHSYKYKNTPPETTDPTPTDTSDPYTSPINLLVEQASPILGQIFEGEMGQKNMKQNDVFNPIQGFHGFNYQSGGIINETGYTPGTNSFTNPINIIPSNIITMKDTPFPVIGKSLETGEVKIMKPGQKYKFKNTSYVIEVPQDLESLAKYQKGGNVQGSGSYDASLLKTFPELTLQDPRNTLNAGKRKLIEIQTEEGEYLSSPLGDLVKVAAKRRHKDQESDNVSDITADGNYVFSNDKSMTIKKEKGVGKVKGISFDDIVLGKDILYYEEGGMIKEPEEYKLSDIEPNKSKYTFAEGVENLAKKFPVTDRKKDPFAMRAQVENKQSRRPYIEALIQLSELKRPTQLSNPNSKFKKGGFTNIGSIYNRALNQNLKTIQDGSISGDYLQEDPLLGFLSKKDNNIVNKFQGGGPIEFDDRNKGQNKREQWNYWLNQLQDRYNEFTFDQAIPSLKGQSLFNTLGVLGQNAYEGYGEYLNGTQYLSRLDNLQNKQDRSFNAEEAYYKSLGDEANSSIRMGANAGIDPNSLVALRSNAFNSANQGIAGLNRERRSYADKYGAMGLNATDMFAGRQNQQRAYLNDFANNRVQNLAGIGSQYLANENQAKAANLAAQSQYQLMKQPGNGWTDFTNGLGDALNAITGLVGAFTGLGFGGGNNNGEGVNWGYNSSNHPNASWGNPPAGYQSQGTFGWVPAPNGFNTPLHTNTGGSYRDPSYDPYVH